MKIKHGYRKVLRNRYTSILHRAKIGGYPPPKFTDKEFYQKACMAIEDGLCFYCRVPLSNKNISVDHRKAIAKGGSHELDNLDFICVKCNRDKGTLTPLEYIAINGYNPQWKPSMRPKLGAVAIGKSREAVGVT